MDRCQRLEEARDLLAEAIRECASKRDLAVLVSEYRKTLTELDALTVTVEVDALDEIAARRSARRSSPAPRSARAKRSS